MDKISGVFSKAVSLVCFVGLCHFVQDVTHSPGHSIIHPGAPEPHKSDEAYYICG